MANSIKKRNLINQDGIQPCWNDVVEPFLNVGKKLIDLEYGDKKADLTAVRKQLKELKKKISDFEQRLKGPVTDEIFTIAAYKNANYKGNPDSLIKYRSETN